MRRLSGKTQCDCSENGAENAAYLVDGAIELPGIKLDFWGAARGSQSCRAGLPVFAPRRDQNVVYADLLRRF
jgi:hypothetical protein